MLRTDGKFSIYVIEHQWNNNNKWVMSIENEWYFKSTNICWYETGIHGTYDLEEAKAALKECINLKDPNREFRLVLYDIFQNKTVI